MILFINAVWKKTTTKLKIRKSFSSLSLIDVGVYLRDGPFESDIGNAKLHPTSGIHWVAYISETYFDIYDYGALNKLCRFFTKPACEMYLF